MTISDFKTATTEKLGFSGPIGPSPERRGQGSNLSRGIKGDRFLIEICYATKNLCSYFFWLMPYREYRVEIGSLFLLGSFFFPIFVN